MKKYLITLIPVVLLGWQRGPVQENRVLIPTESSLQDDIKPVAAQHRAEELTTRILSNYHYRKIKLNDSLSSAIFDRYIDGIDHSRLYYLASDLEDFEKYRLSFDDYLQNKELAVPFDIYNVFRKRYKERSEYIQALLKEPAPFDFSVDESINTDREKAPWAKSTDELNDTWRKYLKSEALDLKLSGKADTSVVTTLRDRYKNRDRALGRIRTEQVFQMFMNAYAESLDPHTSYMAPTSADRFKQEMSQSLEGIGALLREEDNYIKIVEVIPGGPAFKGKQLKKEDKILAVAQGDEGKMVDIVGWFVDDAVKLIKGPKGTVVRLQILSADALPGTPPKEYRLVREKIKLEEQRAKKEVVSVSASNKTYKVGVIDIPLFYRDFEGAQQKEKEFSSTTRDVQKLITELQQENVDGIVIDLRNNGGGSLTEAVSLTGLFINKGPVVQVKEGQTGDIEVQPDTDPAIAYNGPMAVMVNRFSASASEIFAAAIQDYKRGIIVGEQTYGKGTVQTLIDLNQWVPKETDQLGQVKLTVAKFYRINGSSTQLKGVTPDLDLPTAFKTNEYGEGSQASALPWDQIATARFESTNMITDKILGQLKDKYKHRLNTDEELKTLVKTLDEFKKARENKIVSLQEAKRKVERDEAEKKRLAMKQLGEDSEDEEDTLDGKAVEAPKSDKKKKDIYLTETGRMLVDLIQLSKEPSLAGAKKK
ncbi:Tail-specific protease [Dyadobacter sp. CECT 9275]|uniref:Tail-specific protease n=1 Tax=Dyadobacter helix TaxID=2822344 RepID=A0A916J7R9_9BACT|nr:carboxy terminal-processing peptidase [Dyadobacter sp. CECT 9275]CAG4990745.1 Tail-specific protease [Dyadobacter sp. CECT 9275]